MKISNSFFSRMRRQSLSELDEFYKNTVSLFSKETIFGDEDKHSSSHYRTCGMVY